MLTGRRARGAAASVPTRGAHAHGDPRVRDAPPVGTAERAPTVSAACGLAVIDYIERHGVLENVRARGAELETRLRSIAHGHPTVGELRGRGLLYCLDFVAPATGGPLSPAQPFGTAVQQAARRRGLLVRASPHNVTLAPPLVLTAAEVTEIADILGIPEGTARSRLHYATEAMRAALEADARPTTVAHDWTA